MDSSRKAAESSCRRRVDFTKVSSPKDRIHSQSSITKNRISSAGLESVHQHCNRTLIIFLVVSLAAIFGICGYVATERNPIAAWDPPTTLQDLKFIDTTLILVLSAPSNRKRRDAIRETWGREFPNIRFAVGNSDPSLADEATACQDMLLLDAIEDTYDALSHKLHAALQWLDDQSNVQWVVKADDDMFLQLSALQNLLKTFNPQTPTVMGCILQDEPVRKYGKWNEEIFEGPIFPTFPQGSCGYVISRAVVQYVVGITPLEFYHGEDTSLGIWLSSWRTQNGASVVRWIHAPSLFVNDGDCENHPNAVSIGHKISPEHMRKCYSSSLTLHSRKNVEDILQIGLGLRKQGNKRNSTEYKQAVERYQQKQYSAERERKREQKRQQREEQRQRLARNGST